MEHEAWKHCDEFPRYDISNEGNIRNHKTGRAMSTYISDRGYTRVSLTEDGKQYTRNVSTLVGRMFVDGYEDGMVITHKDGDKTNPEASNLEWRKPKDILSEKNGRNRKVKCVESGKEYKSINDCSRDTGIGRRAISRCANQASLSTKAGLHFEFVE